MLVQCHKGIQKYKNSKIISAIVFQLKPLILDVFVTNHIYFINYRKDRGRFLYRLRKSAENGARGGYKAEMRRSSA